MKKLRLARPSCMQGCGADDVTFMYHLPMSALWHGSRGRAPEPEREPQPALSLARPGLVLIVQKNSTTFLKELHETGVDRASTNVRIRSDTARTDAVPKSTQHSTEVHRRRSPPQCPTPRVPPRATIKNPPARLPGRLYCRISWAMRPMLPIPKLILSSSACHPCLRKAFQFF